MAITDTARLIALVDQTQITKPASWPALTSPAPESGWIRTHSCGFVVLGAGLDELGFGLGLGELGFGLGVVVELGLGVVVAGDDDDEPDEDDEAAEVDVLGLDDGLSLSDLREDADELADLSKDAEELSSAAAGAWSAALVLADDSTVLLGMSGHVAELMTD